MKSGVFDVRTAASPSSCEQSTVVPLRVGVIVPKYGHIIVERNRLRRRLRELVRTRLLPALAPALAPVAPAPESRRTDVLIRALPPAYSASFDGLAREMDALIARLGATSRGPTDRPGSGTSARHG